jgi:hypothetical protein
LSLKFHKENFHALLLDLGKRLGIDARRSPVASDPLPCLPQDVTPVDAVIQSMETTPRPPLGGHP